jgi:5'-nucleotidase
MKQMWTRFGPVAVAFVLSACAPLATQTPAASSKQVEVKLIAFNDFHGNLTPPGVRVPVADATQTAGVRVENAGGIEQFSALVRTLKAKNPNHVVVSAGDMVGASPLLSTLFKDEPTIEAMNLVGVDFHGVGNHEFDYGVAHLKRLQSGGCAPSDKSGEPACGGRPPFVGANFPFLAANVIEDATGKNLFPPYGVKEFEGVKVAFIGVGLSVTPALVKPMGTKGVSFRDEAETVNALVPQIRAQGIEAIVLLIHEGGMQSGGIDECKDFKGRLANIVKRFDPFIEIVLSAHSHQSYVCDIGGRLVTSAGSFGTLLTEVDITLDRATHRIVGKRARNLVVNANGERDARLTALIDNYTKLSAPLGDRIVAKMAHELADPRRVPVESEMGNLIADAQLYATAAPDRGGAVIALNNLLSIRAGIAPGADGSVSYGALFKAQPFQNDLIVMTLTGAQLKRILEHHLATDRTWLDLSAGFSFTWDAGKPLGERVVAGSMRLNGHAIQPDLQYRVAVNSYLASGNEGHVVFAEGTDRLVSVLDLDALVEYLAAHSPYSPPPLGKRITRLN